MPFSIPGVRYRRPERCHKLSLSSGNGPPPRKAFAIGRNRSHSVSSFAMEVRELSSLSEMVPSQKTIRYRPESKSFCFFVHNRVNPNPNPNPNTICRPSLAADTLEYRHVNLNSFLVRLRCRQAYLSASSMSTSCRGYLTATGDRFQQVPLAVFGPGGPFSAGDRLRRDSPLFAWTGPLIFRGNIFTHPLH